jgi:transforming growth factor-beta-induced protein
LFISFSNSIQNHYSHQEVAMYRGLFAGLSLALMLVFAGAPAAQAQAPEMNIVEIAASNEDFSTLVAAVQAAGLAGALAGEGPFTVFAPTNAAFAALPAGTVEALLADPTGDLTQILLYHVVPGKVMAADVTDGLEAGTLQGGTVRFTVAGGKVMINDAEIVTTDIEASNGVIHVISSVILPSAEEEMATAEVSAPPTTLPVTGGETSNSLLIILMVGLVAAGLAGSSWINRRLATVRAR